MDEQKINKAKSLIINTLKLISLTEDDIEIKDNQTNFDVNINIDGDDSGVFIGHHGETIQSLQLILSLLVNRRLDEWFPVRVNVGDYRQRREENLIKRAQAALERALDTGEEVILPNLNSYERRQVHMYFQNHDLVTTQSVGTEPYRQLVIVPKSLLKD